MARKRDGRNREKRDGEKRGRTKPRKRDGGKFSLLRKGDGPCNIKQEIII